MNIKSILKKIVPHLIAVVVMLIVSSIYFQPAWEGKTLQQDDIVNSQGANRERIDYKEYEGKSIIWNNTIFSGMPNLMNVSYSTSNFFMTIWKIPQNMGIPTEVAFLFWYMLGFYIFLISIRINPWLALGGALFFGLTTYNLVIINAGHFKKVRTIALIPPTLGGILCILRGRYLTGFILTSFFLAMQIVMNHVQMSYYFLLGLICIGFVELYFHFKQKKYLEFGKKVGILLLAALFGILPNYANLSNLYQYNKESIRGKSELTIGNEEVKTESGLDRDYINQWSSSISESMMMFIPNVKGGMSGYISQDRSLLNKVSSTYRQVLGNMNQYWGGQISSGAPNYIGAILFFLFFLGLFVVKGPLKIGILISTALYVMLSWGKYFPGFTDLFIDYVPLYNKFRTPVSILAIAAITVTFFAIYTVDKIIKNPEILTERIKIPGLKKTQPAYFMASILFFGFLLFNLIFPQLFNSYLSPSEIDQFDTLLSQNNNNPQITEIINALINFRISVFRSDVIRTLLFSLAVFGSIYLFLKKKIKSTALIITVSLLAVIDLWGIDKRYVNDDHFTSENLIENVYRLSDTDKQIYQLEMQQDTTIISNINQTYQEFQPNNEIEQESLQTYIINKYTHYRVYNLTTPTFQENVTASAHRSIGGYHAAKLRRYQDLIEHHISTGNRQVLNMLNTKYIITSQGLQLNREALGPAWFVDSVIWANDANGEIQALDSINTLRETVINEKDRSFVSDFNPSSEGDSIYLYSYDPDYMIYKSKAPGKRLAVFSEIYYPGWTVLIDGKETNYFTVNYVLRGIMVPEGDHTIEFIFKPDYVYTSNKFSLIFFFILIGSILVILGYKGYQFWDTHKIKSN